MQREHEARRNVGKISSLSRTQPHHVHFLGVEAGEQEDKVLAELELSHGGVTGDLVKHLGEDVGRDELVHTQEAEEILKRGIG